MPKDPLPRSEQTREAIVQAAHNLFIQQGYHGTSMRQIAGDAGIALGSLYNHFNGKENVFEAVFLEYHPYHQVLPLLMDVRGKTIEERVRYAAHQMVKAVDERPDFLNLFFIEVVEFRSEHAKQLFSIILPRAIEIAHKIINDQEHRIKAIPDAMLVRSFLGLFFSYYLTEILFAYAAPDEFRINAMEYLVNIYLHGILENNSQNNYGSEPKG